MSKSITFFLPTLTPGGIEKSFCTLANEFQTRGYHTEVVVCKTGSFSDELDKSVSLVELNLDRTIQALNPLMDYISSENVDVLVSGHTHANIVAYFSSRLASQSTTFTATVHTPHSISQSNPSNLSSLVTRLLYPFVYSRADHIIAVCDYVANDLHDSSKFHIDNLDVIPNPIKIDDIKSQANKSVDHKWLFDEEVDVILGVGRFVKEKNYISLLKAFNRLNSDDSQTRLILLGDGPRREQLSRYIMTNSLGDFVDMPGFHSNPYVFMKNSSVFVQPSLREGLPMTLIEAMACGIPIVATDCPGGHQEILANGQYGSIVPENDVFSLVEGIKEQLIKPTDQELLFNRAEEFSVSIIAELYEQILFDR